MQLDHLWFICDCSQHSLSLPARCYQTVLSGYKLNDGHNISTSPELKLSIIYQRKRVDYTFTSGSSNWNKCCRVLLLLFTRDVLSRLTTDQIADISASDGKISSFFCIRKLFQNQNNHVQLIQLSYFIIIDWILILTVNTNRVLETFKAT